MSVVFADTFYWIALANRNDGSHRRVVEFARSFSGQAVTTEFVLIEVADGLSSVRHRNLFQSLRTLWRTDERLTIVGATHDLFDLGFDLFCDRSDKEWSLTDCISFMVMQEQGITEALTADRHFEQAGFVAMLS